jgi:hypothetical protein
LSIAFGVARSVLEEATTRLIVPPHSGVVGPHFRSRTERRST